MTHLDEGTLVALRDGEATMERSAELHVAACDACHEALDASRQRSHAIAAALALLDDPVDVPAAKAAVRRRLDARREPQARARWTRWHLGRAAAILLVTAGAASALPWSPVRHLWFGTPPAEPTTVTSPVTGAAAVQGAPPVRITVGVPVGRIDVVVRGATPGSVIEVVWVDAQTARVSAPAESGFTYADGRVEVDAAPGSIEAELPRAARLATLQVDGVTYLRRTAAGLEAPGPVLDRSEDRVRFLVPER